METQARPAPRPRTGIRSPARRLSGTPPLAIVLVAAANVIEGVRSLVIAVLLPLFATAAQSLTHDRLWSYAMLLFVSVVAIAIGIGLWRRSRLARGVYWIVAGYMLVKFIMLATRGMHKVRDDVWQTLGVAVFALLLLLPSARRWIAAGGESVRLTDRELP